MFRPALKLFSRNSKLQRSAPLPSFEKNSFDSEMLERMGIERGPLASFIRTYATFEMDKPLDLFSFRNIFHSWIMVQQTKGEIMFNMADNKIVLD